MRYMYAIWDRGGGPNIFSALHYNAQKFKSLNGQDNFCGKGFWGYGLNCISNGKDKICMADIMEIEKLNMLNKHHEPFRRLQVLTFKVEGRFVYVSMFSIDSCTVGVVSDINRKYDLCNFENARLLTNGQKTTVEFIFKGLAEPISFQVEDYHFPANLSGDRLARYYLETMKKAADPYISETPMPITSKPDFIEDLASGIKQLQNQGKRAECFRKLVDENKKDEGGFRDFFQIILEAKGYAAEAEPQKSNGRIDLKLTHPQLSTKIVEFKGWWNDDKKNIVNQLYGYLTDFDGEGYVFLINHTSKNITQEYMKLVCTDTMNFSPDSWEKIEFKDTAFSYFKSKHQFATLKTMYHFIFSVC